ncbi:metallophosphoesterase family protein [Deinococcus sp. Arct2-2]|uniref:metallophosphoesterase family protein n=1 Tax=Deinococcus sp. Arct2-2 TaxID=2568653 RepID=UPI0010A33A23|nr:metallophosphoesterase family protein [Deinococcus sp. Arct2-2]THF71910.1 metallophosphoesterase family protein [Deinococcus sp. Arct2-2]
MKVGQKVLVISDTHGLLRPEVVALVRQADVVLHAGDVGRPEILEALGDATSGKVYAIRGNVDRVAPLNALPKTLLLELGGVWVYLLHDLNTLDLVPEVAGVQVVISGHTHQPKLEQRGGVLFLNPGSVGPRRFRLPIACAWLHLSGGQITAEPVTLEV